jgi:hypothetical protein
VIRCLICGRDFEFLPPHLRLAHGTDAAQYREAFDIAEGQPLASEAYRDARRERMREMQSDGTITYVHLPQAVERAKAAIVRPKRGTAREKQRDVVARAQPWAAHQLPPGAKRADGRDADRAREYQRRYRAAKNRKPNQ